jgi:cyclic pyranopterin phosphate synthase
MVDVGAKMKRSVSIVILSRIAIRPATFRMWWRREARKGRRAGRRAPGSVQAAHRRKLISLAHPIAITRVGVQFALERKRNAVRIVTTVECRGRTGVEMEALTAAAVGLLAIYDMLKAVDRGMKLGELRLDEKRGGRSGTYRRRAHRSAKRMGR